MTGGGGNYTYNATTNAITRAAGNLPAGHIITFIYSVMFPQTVYAEDAGEIAAHGRYQATREAPDIFDKAEAYDPRRGAHPAASRPPKKSRCRRAPGSSCQGP